MALMTCKECSKEHSDSAKVCPHCGFKRQKQVGVIGIIAVLFFGYWVYSCNSRPSSPLQNYDAKVDKAIKAIAEPVAGTAPPPPSWSPWESTDDVTGKIEKSVSIRSNESVDLHFPYGPNIFARLVIRKHPRYGKDVIISLDKGQILCHSYDPCTLNVRFDSNPPIRVSASPPSDGKSDTVFLSGFDRIVSNIKKSETMLVELPLYQDGNRTWTFNVKDFDPSWVDQGKVAPQKPKEKWRCTNSAGHVYDVTQRPLDDKCELINE